MSTSATVTLPVHRAVSTGKRPPGREICFCCSGCREHPRPRLERTGEPCCECARSYKHPGLSPSAFRARVLPSTSSAPEAEVRTQLQAAARKGWPSRSPHTQGGIQVSLVLLALQEGSGALHKPKPPDNYSSCTTHCCCKQTPSFVAKLLRLERKSQTVPAWQWNRASGSLARQAGTAPASPQAQHRVPVSHTNPTLAVLVCALG